LSLEVDGSAHLFQDPLLDQLVGDWKINGRIAGQKIEHWGRVDWILNHQFLRIHFLDAARRTVRETKNNLPYEAFVFVGYDNMSERYVAHWLDTFGGRYSEILGFGEKIGRYAIKFTFEGGTGPLHNTLTWNPTRRSWNMRIVQKNEKGKWTLFGDETLQRVRA
jgi:hypothetical protein